MTLDAGIENVGDIIIGIMVIVQLFRQCGQIDGLLKQYLYDRQANTPEVILLGTILLQFT